MSIGRQTDKEIMNLRCAYSFCPSRSEWQLQCATRQIQKPRQRPSLSDPGVGPTELPQTEAESGGGNCQTIQWSSQGSVVPSDHGCPSLLRQHLRSWDKFCSRH